MPSQGDVVLIPVPFTDLSSVKRRPVIVVSNDRYNQSTGNIVVAAMTSVPARNPYSLQITSADLVAGALNHPGTVREDKIYTLDQRIVAKTFGKVNDVTLGRIRRIFEDLCKP
jgi:mRNA interferase MazF